MKEKAFVSPSMSEIPEAPLKPTDMVNDNYFHKLFIDWKMNMNKNQQKKRTILLCQTNLLFINSY